MTALPSSAGLHSSIYFTDHSIETAALADHALAANLASPRWGLLSRSSAPASRLPTT